MISIFRSITFLSSWEYDLFCFGFVCDITLMCCGSFSFFINTFDIILFLIEDSLFLVWLSSEWSSLLSLCFCYHWSFMVHFYCIGSYRVGRFVSRFSILFSESFHIFDFRVIHVWGRLSWWFPTLVGFPFTYGVLPCPIFFTSLLFFDHFTQPFRFGNWLNPLKV